MVFVCNYVFETNNEAGEFPRRSRFYFLIDFRSSYKRFLRIHREESIEVLLARYVVEVKLNPLNAGEGAFLKIFLDVAEVLVGSQAWFRSSILVVSLAELSISFFTSLMASLNSRTPF